MTGQAPRDLNGIVHELADRDRLEMDMVLCRQGGHLRPVLLEDQRSGRNRECLAIDWRGEVDLGVRAWPKGPIVVINCEDRDRGARAHIESSGDG